MPLRDAIPYDTPSAGGGAGHWPDASDAWCTDSPCWGLWGVPESEVRLFPPNLAGCDAVELGCGNARISAWMERRGARVVAVDPSPRELAVVQRLQQLHALPFPLLQASPDEIPLPDRSFDFAIAEYGACLRTDPYRFIPEAWRLLRPGGRLSLLTRSWLMVMCSQESSSAPVGDRLVRSAFGPQRMQCSPIDGIEIHLSHGDWIRLFRATGFEVEDLVEIRPAEDAVERFAPVTREWARRWPSEEVWKVRKRGNPRRG